MSSSNQKDERSTQEQSDSTDSPPRSGAGAGTALSAMLKKRQMRATQDTEPEAPPPLPNSAEE